MHQLDLFDKEEPIFCALTNLKASQENLRRGTFQRLDNHQKDIDFLMTQMQILSGMLDEFIHAKKHTDMFGT